MIIRKTTVAGRVIAIFMVIALLFAANCCVLDASAATLGTTIYVKTTKTTNPYIYFWVDGGKSNPSWPGVAMTAEGDNVYSYELPYDVGELTGIIVNKDGSGDKLTGDVKNITGNLYDLDSAKWDTYDTSGVKISSFAMDMSEMYVGSKATLTASAEGDGAVSFKFSANGAVISDFSAKSSVVWAPTAAGDYTITLDVKDAAGNTNSKTLSCTVKSVDGAEEPIFLSASPANGSLISYGTDVTVTVNGAGGQVNNKILFYKTEVVDPSGKVVNTAYYQKSNKISFKPTSEGAYTVNMYIQNNTVANTTTMATYTYNSVMGELPDTGTDVPEYTDTEVQTDTSVVSDVDTTTDTVSDVDTTTDTTTDTTESDIDVPETKVGDFDGSGKTELKDAYDIQKNVIAKTAFTAEQIARADVNGDGQITLKDASLIQLYKVGLAQVTADGRLVPPNA